MNIGKLGIIIRLFYSYIYNEFLYPRNRKIGVA